MSATRRLTTAQAVIAFLKNQHIERDGAVQSFFAGALGIFGHGNVAGVGQALQQNHDFAYVLVRNEQAAVHLAAGYAKLSNRLRTWVCTSSIGPGPRIWSPGPPWPRSTACRCCCCPATFSPAETSLRCCNNSSLPRPKTSV